MIKCRCEIDNNAFGEIPIVTDLNNSETPQEAQTPKWTRRLLAASMYCGGAPILSRASVRRSDAYLNHHYVQSLCLYFVLVCIGIIYGAFSFFLSYVLVFQREWYEGTLLEPTMLMVVRRLFLAWLVFWLFGTGWALLGSWRSIPIMGRLAGRKLLLRFTVGAYAMLLVAVALTVSFSVHAATLTRTDDAPASAYMLYDDMGLFPHWVFNLGFYPIARASTEKWGRDSVVVLPLTKERLADAFREGEFVFVLSHGTRRGIYTSDFRVRPKEAASQGVGESLRFVYITGCDSGTLAKEWERTLAPAEVVTFDRLSAWLEHIYWLIFEGADVVRTLD